MELFDSLFHNPLILLVFFGSTIGCAIFGSPSSVLRIAPADWDPMAHSKAYYRSPRAFLPSLLAWMGLLSGAAFYDLLPSDWGWWRGSVILVPLVLAYLSGTMGDWLLRSFLASLPPAPPHGSAP